jgi:hypothetical protein
MKPDEPRPVDAAHRNQDWFHKLFVWLREHKESLAAGSAIAVVAGALGGALATFMSFIWQVPGWIQGPETELIQPRQITLFQAKCPSQNDSDDNVQPRDDREGKLLRIAAEMFYMNWGRGGYNSLMISEKVEFKWKGRKREFEAYGFVDILPPELTSKSAPNFDNFKNFRPMIIPANNLESHETYYGPRCTDPSDCEDLEWDKFLEQAPHENVIDFWMIAELSREENVVKVHCRVDVAEHFLSGHWPGVGCAVGARCSNAQK